MRFRLPGGPRVGLAFAALLLGSFSAAPAPRVDRLGGPYTVLLGVAQDGGYPQADCRRACCARAWARPELRRHVVSLAVVDPERCAAWLFEATPDFREQLHELDAVAKGAALSGVFVTHAHVGHYAGLLHLGREAMGAREAPVFAMPRLSRFLASNGPWSQLVSLRNVSLVPLAAGVPVPLTPELRVTPLLVPHRDEFSETVAFRIEGPRRSVLFLPDIDKWDRWERDLAEEISTVDAAYLDATFFDAGELPGRSMREIPHPFVVETLAAVASLPAAERAKVRLVHFNHTNPLLRDESPEAAGVRAAGLHVARQGERLELSR